MQGNREELVLMPVQSLHSNKPSCPPVWLGILSFPI